VAQFAKEIKRADAERDLQRNIAERAAQEVSELRAKLSRLTQENTTLKASLASAEENLGHSTAQVQEERRRSECLSSRSSAAERTHASEMAAASTRYNAVLAELRKVQRELAVIRSTPWWRRIRL
jgi:regulator of replication initiation timing